MPEIIQVQKQQGDSSCNCKVAKFIPMRYATSSFRSIYHCKGSPDITCKSGTTYSVENGWLFTSFCDGVIQLAYRSIPTDKDGLPMIPDNPKILRALEAYVKVQYYTILFDNRLLPDMRVLELAKQDYAWAIGSAQSQLNKIDDAMAENIKNIYNRLIWNSRGYNTGFKNIAEEEILKRQP